MLYTYIHHKEYTDASWDVAHIYEHLVTRSFQSYLESLSINPGLIGHISGDTFEHIIFLNATFYDQRIVNAYEHFLTKPELIDTSYASQMLLECESEEKVVLALLQDKAKFNEQLQGLIATPWADNNSVSQISIDETTDVATIFQVKRAAKEFRDISVGAYVAINDMDDKERVLFLRLSALIGDVIGFAIRKELAGYYVTGSPISKDDALMGSTHRLSLKQNVSLKSIKEVCEAAISDINIEPAMPLITAQFEEFADRATWKASVIDYYRHTGIVTNTGYIASLATRDRISTILPKIKIHVRSIRNDDEKQF